MGVLALPGLQWLRAGLLGSRPAPWFCGSCGFRSSTSDTLIIFRLELRVTPGRCRNTGAPEAKGAGTKEREKTNRMESGRTREAGEEVGAGLDDRAHKGLGPRRHRHGGGMKQGCSCEGRTLY